jgi:hypothetical protein
VAQDGKEDLNFNVVDVSVDCDEHAVSVERVIDLGLPAARLSTERFKEVATPLAEPRSEDEREQWRRKWVERSPAWPMPGPTDAEARSED